MKIKTCKECGKPLPPGMQDVGLCYFCVDVVESLAGELDTNNNFRYCNDTEDIFVGDY